MRLLMHYSQVTTMRTLTATGGLAEKAGLRGVPSLITTPFTEFGFKTLDWNPSSSTIKKVETFEQGFRFS